MERREFLFVQSTTEQGGAETVLLNALRASAELRSRSLVVTLGFGAGDLPSRIRAEGVEVIELERARIRQPFKALGVAKRIAAEARLRGVRVIIGNGAHPQVFAGIAAMLAPARSAYFVHEIHDSRLLANHPIKILAIKGHCDLVIANSQATLAPLQALRSRLEHSVLYPGTPVGNVAAMVRTETRAGLGIASDVVLFGVFGRLQRGKGQDVFLEAAAQVAGAYPASHFMIVGGTVFGLEREYRGFLARRCAELGIHGKVTFTGQVGDIAALMGACDVVCQPSRARESFGMAIVEAMAQGRPVIATRTGGPAEIVLHGETGLLISPDDARSLAAAMAFLAENPRLREAYGAQARRRVVERFSSEQFASQLLRLLSEAA